MQNYKRFTLMALPQFFNGTDLSLNIVVLPRNQNPLAPAIEADPTVPDAVAFAEAKFTFEAKIISGLETFPNSLAATASRALVTAPPADAQNLFTALGQQFKIQNLSHSNQVLDANVDRANLKPPVLQETSVFKYLPLSYRHAFNFTSPRTKNASTGDAYSCAVRSAGFVPGFQRSSDEISWGKVFAYALRQPLLAAQLGMIYKTSLTISTTDYPHGGWLYVDLADDSDYRAQQRDEETFIKRYAVRIPALTPGAARPVFAPVLIPVLSKANAGDPDPAPDGNYDDLFIEAADYDDGFGKITHAFQPVSLNLLAEESDGAHPVKDVGIRLGWDDEQILIWYMRQMMIDPTVTGPDKRLDAPLTVFGYAIDVRETATPPRDWESLTSVRSKAPLSLQYLSGGAPASISLGDFSGELPYQVYPSQLDGDLTKSYWLPMYFASWNGHSMVLPDEDAANIYQNTADVKADPLTLKTGTGVSGPAQILANKIYEALSVKSTLLYGNRYEFRVRLRDLSGGGTDNNPAVKPLNISPSSIGHCHFKRYVAPQSVRVKNLTVNSDVSITDVDLIELTRPLLGYPAVAYTGKYADPVGLLTQASKDMVGKEAFGIEDPDVDEVEVTVEVESLRMDNLLSVSGKDNYVLLYKTRRSFPAVNKEGDYRKHLSIPIVYKDCKVLHVGSELDLKTDLGLANDIDKLSEIVLPTARTARVTLRAVCEDKANNADYYGLISSDPEMDTRFGRTVQMRLYKESADESDLFLQSPAEMVRGIYLQPDPPAVLDGNFLSVLFGKQVDKPADLIQRLANQLNLANTGLTLTGAKGERVQFGCSNRIRHTLSPESSSLTFSSKGDLMNHWLSCITLDLNRDWTWDALASRSFVIERKMRFTRDSPVETVTEVVGDIEIRHTASFEALQDPRRNFARLVFIDAVEPKNHRMRPNPNQNEPRFPDTIEITYSITPVFKGNQPVGVQELALDLPITTTPTQIPKIVSAGLALSPYQRNKKYSATEPRRRYLWIEFEEPIHDPQDTYFARVLAYAPDQLISNNHPELLVAPDEPVLPIDPEPIRVVPPPVDPATFPTNDLAGLNAMQPMEKASDSDRHYLLPLPPGLHADAPEMFGFFTYEFRAGHHRRQLANDTQMSWCTAQGRFGRPLRATGIQHPAPTLTCSVNRDQDRLYVVAPYAVAVLNGTNFTADPPRTQLWCLLYAQVRQADNQDFLNVLLDDKRLDSRVQVELDPGANNFARYDAYERTVLKNITIANYKDALDYTQAKNAFKLIDRSQTNKDATRYGTTVWSNHEVEQLLQNYALPVTSPLSVLVVEMLPTITRFNEHYTVSHDAAVAAELSGRLQLHSLSTAGPFAPAYLKQSSSAVDESPRPLSDELGQHRILRSSPLTEVPYIC
jgi:hypothetical protein